MFRTAFTRSTVSRSIVVVRQLHASPVVGKTMSEKVTEVADKVNKSVGKGLAGAIDTGEKVVDSTRGTFGSAKHKASDTAQDAQGMAREKMNQASKSTKQAAESTQQKFNQATGEAAKKADELRQGEREG